MHEKEDAVEPGGLKHDDEELVHGVLPPVGEVLYPAADVPDAVCDEYWEGV